MLKFKQKPDNVMNEIITRAINTAIDELNEDINIMIPFGGEAEYTDTYFTKQDKLILGDTEGIIYELKRIKMAHESKDIYIPNNLHFLILDRLLHVWCSTYNTLLHAMDINYQVMYKGKPITHVDVNDIIDLFFWNTDYDLILQDDMIFNYNTYAKQLYNVSDESIKASLNSTPNADDLNFKICNVMNDDWYNNESIDWRN